MERNQVVPVEETISKAKHGDSKMKKKGKKHKTKLKDGESSYGTEKTDVLYETRNDENIVPEVSISPAVKRQGFTKKVSLNTRKPMQRQESVSQFLKEYLKTSDNKDVILDNISEYNHGTLEFLGYDNESGGHSPFLKIPQKIHPIRVWEVMTDWWKCPVPNLIIAITGGTQKWRIGPKLQEKFKRGLIIAAATTGSWIITCGTKSGTTEYIGKAVKEHVISSGGHSNIVTLGITPWESIYKSEGLIRRTSGHTTQSHVIYDIDQRVRQEVTENYLDNNHTHFILVDNTSKNTEKIDFESNFEKFLSGSVQIPGARTETDGSQIPLIRILIDGGYVSLRAILGSVKSYTPVIVLDGSGGAANLIADVCGRSDKLSDSDIRQMVTKPEYGMLLSNDQIEPCVDVIKEIIGNRIYLQMLNIFHIAEFETKEFDKVILESLLKARESNAAAKLLVSLAWNRTDIAEKQIFTPENRESLKPELNNLLVIALIQNKHEFVRLLIEQGTDLNTFFNIKNLWNLYSNCLMDSTCKAAELLNNLIVYRQHTLAWYRHLPCFRHVEIEHDDRDLLIAIGDAVEYLLQDEVMNPYPAHRDFQVNLKSCEMGYIEDNPVEPVKKGVEVVECTICGGRKLKAKIKSRHDRLFDGPVMQLFLWALLFNRMEMAKIFWSMVQRNNIASTDFNYLMPSGSNINKQHPKWHGPIGKNNFVGYTF